MNPLELEDCIKYFKQPYDYVESATETCNIYNFTQEDYNIKVSVAETKHPVVSKEPKRRKLADNNKIVENVMAFNCPGVEARSDRNFYQTTNQERKAAVISRAN